MYVHGEGGCIHLVGRPIRRGQEWLKNLSIFEAMLRHFNLSMVIAFDGAHVHTFYVCPWGGALTLLNVPCVGN